VKLSNIYKIILNENPNQAIKFLKEKNLDPLTNPKGKRILDSVNAITKGDGYTYLMTRFYVNERMLYDELQELYEYLKINKDFLTRLPSPVVSYVSYRKLRMDIDNLENQRSIKRIYNLLSPELKQQVDNLSVVDKQQIVDIAKQFQLLTTEQQRHFAKKTFAYTNIWAYMTDMGRYTTEVQNKQDYESTKQKITATPNAYLVYDNPEKDIIIAHIDSYDASKTLGCTSAWCITRDIVRFREYKRGGNKYFFIWDYNYSSQDPNFFIATAYNEKNPPLSRTHEHKDDSQLKLNDVLKSKNLNVIIFNQYLKIYNENRINTHSTESGLFNALQNRDKEKILDLINSSETFGQFESADPYVYAGNKKVFLGLSRENMLEMLEIDADEFNYVQSSAMAYYGDGSDYDSDNGNYMHSGLDQNNMDLLIDIAKKVGVGIDVYGKFKDEEGMIASFLNKYGMEDIIDTYVSEYGEAENEGEQNEAKDILSKIPFNIDEGEFYVDAILKYWVDNEIKAENFDELIVQIKPLLPTISADAVNEGRYNIDMDGIDKKIKDKLKTIIFDMENDEDNEYYERSNLLLNAHKQLLNLGFILLSNDENIAEKEYKNRKIIVKNVENKESDEEDSPPIIYITVDLLKDDQYGFQVYKTIKIPLSSLRNYIDQLELQFVTEQILRNFKLS